MKTKTILTVLAAALLLGAFMLPSCEGPVALGKKLNLDPPVVVIEHPDFMQDASDFLIIDGTAWDKEEVVYLYLDIEQVVKNGTDDPWKHYWRGSRNNVWEWRPNEREPWAPHLGGPQLNETAWDLQGGKNDIRWSLNLDVSRLENGEYIISVNAENNVKNAGTVEQRRVIVDHEPPVVKVQAPVLEFDDTDRADDEKFSYRYDIYPKLNSYRLQDAAVLSMLHNQSITIQYEIEDDFSIEELAFQFYDIDGNCYYNEDEKDVTELGFPLGWSGQITIDESEISGPLVSGTYPLFLQLVSIAADRAGNQKIHSHGWLVWWPESDLPWVEGFDVKNPAFADGSDEAHEGHRVYPGSEVQGQAFDDDGVQWVSYRLYASRDLDDEDISRWENAQALEKTPVYRSIDKDNVETVFTDTVPNIPLDPNSPPSAFFSWHFTAPLECDTYQVVIDCEDINGLGGHQIARYIYVYDINAPDVELSSPDEELTLFGDASGNIKFSGEASDGVNPTRLTMVWLNPEHPDVISSLVNYQAAGYGIRDEGSVGWNAAKDGPFTTPALAQGVRVDIPVVNGTPHPERANLMWEIELPEHGAQDPESKRMSKHFEFTVSLFSDLLIPDEVKLVGQTFIFRVEGDVESRAVAKMVSFKGDSVTPEVSVERVAVYRQGALLNFYTREYLLQPNGLMASLLPTDQIYLYGYWNDDSYDAWQAARMRGFTVEWNGVPVGPILNPDDPDRFIRDPQNPGEFMQNPDWVPEYGKPELRAARGRGADGALDADSWGWAAGPMEIDAEEATRGGGFIEVRLTDPAGTPALDGLSAKILTDKPFLMFISSSNPDGYYREGDEVLVYLEFNKLVRVAGSAPPTLTMAALNGASLTPATLDNGLAINGGYGGGDFEADYEGIAMYDERNEFLGYGFDLGKGAYEESDYSMRHYFKYTVPASHTADRLTVFQVNAEACEFQTMQDIPAEIAISGGNLGNMKNIAIDTTAPSIVGVEVLGFDDDFTFLRAPRSLNIRVEFNEAINYEANPANLPELELNLSSGTGKGIMPSPSGTHSLLFTYTVDADDNTGNGTPSGQSTGLLVESLLSGAVGSIRDRAGNSLNTMPGQEFPLAGLPNLSGIPALERRKFFIVDNTKPRPDGLTITGIETLATSPGPSSTGTKRFKVTGRESGVSISGVGMTQGATVQYSIDGEDGPWHAIPHPAEDHEIALSAVMDYKLSVRQIDEAGNVGDGSKPVYFKIATTTPLLLSLGGSATGTYSQGDEVFIELIMRENITVSGTPSLTLTGFSTGGSTRTASYDQSSNGTSKMRFTYKISGDESDNAEKLEFRTINMTGVILTANGSTVTDELNERDGWDTGNLRLSTFTTITIDTIVPVFQSGSLNASGTQLTLNFSKAVYKAVGDITITQATRYDPPAVMDKADFQRWGGAAVLGAYYEVGTNGAYPNGDVDTSEKYILRYSINPASTTGEAAALRAILTGDPYYAHQRVIPIASPRVAPSADRRAMIVDLSPASGFELRVKGVAYDVKIDGGLVQDQQGKATQGESFINGQAIGGVNPPFVRVDRATARTQVTQGANSGNVRTVNITQPYTANVRIDTQTPDATFNWTYNTTTTAPQSGEVGDVVSVLFWVRNASLSATAQSGNNWRETGNFSIAFMPEFQQRFTSDGIKAAKPASDVNDFFIPSYVNGGGDNGQTLYSNDAWNDFMYGWYGEGLPGRSRNYFVNPYAAKVTTSNGSPGYFDIEAGWPGYAGDNVNNRYMRMGSVWVNLNTPGAQTTQGNANPAAKPQGGGWIPISEAEGGGRLFDGDTHPAKPGVAMPQAATGGGTSGTSATFTLGVANNADNGYLYGITARASKGGANSALSHEKVSRSVIRFNNIAEAGSWTGGNNSLRSRANAQGKSLHLWVRGGDGLSGDSLTPGFPLQWSDRARGGAGLLSGPDDGLKYWISWEISVSAYFHFVAGTTDTAAEAANGPLDWGWAKNSWSFQHHRYPLHPGGSMHFVVGGVSALVVDSATQYFEFYNTGFSGSR